MTGHDYNRNCGVSGGSPVAGLVRIYKCFTGQADSVKDVFGRRVWSEIALVDPTIDFLDPVSTAPLLQSVIKAISDDSHTLYLLVTQHLPRGQAVLGASQHYVNNIGIGIPVRMKADLDRAFPDLRIFPAAFRFIWCGGGFEGFDLRSYVTHEGRSSGCRVCDPKSPSSCDQVLHVGVDFLLAPVGSGRDKSKSARELQQMSWEAEVPLVTCPELVNQ